MVAAIPKGACPLATPAELNLFLAEVERRAFRMASYAVGDSDKALDIVQESMFAFVRRYSDKPSTTWSPLFFRVLQSKISDSRRRRSLMARVFGWLGSDNREDDVEDPLQCVADPRDETPLRLLERADLGKQLEQSIAGLPLRQQQAFLLRAWEGLNVTETALAMGCTEGSVKTHYFRAVQALRQKLEAHQP